MFWEIKKSPQWPRLNQNSLEVMNDKQTLKSKAEREELEGSSQIRSKTKSDGNYRKERKWRPDFSWVY